MMPHSLDVKAVASASGFNARMLNRNQRQTASNCTDQNVGGEKQASLDGTGCGTCTTTATKEEVKKLQELSRIHLHETPLPKVFFRCCKTHANTMANTMQMEEIWSVVY